MPEKSSSKIDIFDLLSGSEEKPEKTAKPDKKKQREELLAPTGVKEFFPEGSLSINKHTCAGVQCKLCIKVCPTNALYWKAGEVGVIEDLCVYCGACVLACMVDDCMKVKRKRENGTVECFSKPKDVVGLQNRINTKKRIQRVQDVFPSWEDYCRKYGLKK
jgi:ferredoxin